VTGQPLFNDMHYHDRWLHPDFVRVIIGSAVPVPTNLQLTVVDQPADISAGETHANTLGTNQHSASASATPAYTSCKAFGPLGTWKIEAAVCDLLPRTRRTLLENFKNKKKPNPETLLIGGQMFVDDDKIFVCTGNLLDYHGSSA
jgi:hypothetical protein